MNRSFSPVLDYQEESDVSQDFFFFFLNRSLDLAAHFKQDLVLRPVSVKGAMGGASRFLQSTILFDWGFQSGFIVAGVAKKSNWNLFFVFFQSKNSQQCRTELLQRRQSRQK